MSLEPGSRLGPYEITALLGSGGMGEVYRARDPRLGRDVAIKVLPDELTQDRERLRRFESEARAASALEHPNVLVVHDVGREGDRPYIVSEVLEGETLRTRLGGSRLGVRKAVEYAKEIAHGLDAAHAKGIVHRDLKPENLFLTRDGRVKILDFGLAALKPAADAPAGSGLETATATSPGLVLGTTGYMSPEQLRGERVDHRSDIFSLGVVLYELVSGQRAFGAGSRADISAAILERDPPEISIAEATPTLRAVLHRCLEKRPEDRFQSARDVAFALDIAAATTEEGRRTPRTLWGMVGALVALGALCLGLAYRLFREPATTARVKHLALTFDAVAPLEEDMSYVPFAIFPDGRRLVFGTNQSQSHFSPLAVRDLASGDTTLLPGSEGGTEPFVSPDGRWIGYYGSSGALKRIPAEGGASIVLCSIPNLSGGTAGPGDTVIFAPRGEGLVSVPGQGGVPEPFTTLGPGEREHLWPQALPGSVLFTVRRGSKPEDFSLAVKAHGSLEHRVVLRGGSRGRYLPSGHLVYAQGHTLLAVPFDPTTLKTRGDPKPLVEKVAGWDPASPQFDVAEDGALVYRLETLPTKQSLVWVDRSGRKSPLPLAPRPLRYPLLDPSGRRVLFLQVEGAAGQQGLWSYDLESDTLTRLTFHGVFSFASWTPDGSAVTYVKEDAEQGFALYRQPIGESSSPRLLYSDRRPSFGGRWLPDQSALVFSILADGGDAFLLRPGGSDPPQLVVGGPGNQWGPRPSPDGRYALYMSDETGRFEVYVIALDGSGQKRQVTTDGGAEAVWNPDGKEIFYRSGSRLLALPVTTSPSFNAGKARILFEGRYAEGAPGIANYSVSPDGRRFLMVEGDYAKPAASLVYVEGWSEVLRTRVPADR